MKPIAALLLLVAVAGAQTPTYKVVAENHQRIEARITYRIETDKFAVNRWLVHLPEPPELPSQAGVESTGPDKSVGVAEESPLARRMRKLDLPVARPGEKSRLDLELAVKATLRTRKLVPLLNGEKPPKVTPLTAVERKHYLAAGESVDFEEKAFQSWLDAKKLRARKGESPLTFAERVLTAIRSDFAYAFSIADKKSSTSCGKSSGDCADMTLVFVGAMRAGGVPARALVGRVAKPRKPGSRPDDMEYDQAHVRAEIFLDGVGWVCVDPSYCHSDKIKPVRFYVGHDPGDLLVLHVDTDLKMRYPDKVRTANMLQVTPHYWSFGNGAFDGKFGPTGWELTAKAAKK